MVLLKLEIGNWIWEREINIPTDSNKCPELINPICTNGTLISQPKTIEGCPRPPICKPFEELISEYKILEILSDNKISLPEANEGQTITIIATLSCKKKDIETKLKEKVYLYIDNALIDEKTSDSTGKVTFDWKATAIPIRNHTICVAAQPSSECNGIAKDCRKISVSPIQLDPSEQLAIERESAREQRKLLEQSRRKLREDIIQSGQDTVLETTQPLIPIYTPTTTPAITEQKPEQELDFGSIEIIGLPIDITPLTPPIYIMLDEETVGRVHELPKRIDNVPIGSHTIYARYKNTTTQKKNIVVFKNQTTKTGLI